MSGENAVLSPVFTMVVVFGFKVIDWMLVRSRPAEPSVARRGRLALEVSFLKCTCVWCQDALSFTY